ncbi:MAG: M36 family metallopeptidase, partial [Bacteroidota bacterium]
MKYLLHKNTLPVILLLLQCNLLFAFHSSGKDPYAVTFIDRTQLLDKQYQQELINGNNWQSFLKNHNDWFAVFNENNGFPHRAFGTPVIISGVSDPASAATVFINSNLHTFINESVHLEQTGITTSPKYIQVNYKQTWQGLEVLFSRLTVKMTHDYKVVLFGADVQNDININKTPKLSAGDAITAATKDINAVDIIISQQPQLKILPLPVALAYDNRLVYEMIVDFNSEGEPASYYTLVDANSGKVLYRSNRVNHFSPGGTNLTINGTIYPTNPYNASAVLPLQYIKVDAGSIFNTDENGFLILPNGTTSATLSLAGLYGIVYTGQTATTVQSFVASLVPGTNTLSFDPSSDINHLTAYYHANVVHDYMKTKLPTFTDMDFPMEIRVDRTDGNCNAFYDGGLNFYTHSNGCNSLSLVNDVVYHEYGHGISSLFYQANGTTFQNGGMNEGYSDTWAICITENPVLGIGFDDTDPAISVRNYDFLNGAQRKVYPQNLVGEVHADGEIICGAWYDVAINLGSVNAMSDLFVEALYGLANGPNGTEGQVFTDVLIDALQADDNDGNLINGTPNVNAIADAFALHGISLLTTANLAHTPVIAAPAQLPVTINAALTNVSLPFAWALSGVRCAYAINTGTTWSVINMTTTNGTNYTVDIPAQTVGTVVKYYIYIEDVNGKSSNVHPSGADAADPNLPYFIRVGYNLLFTDDFDVNSGNWVFGIAGDNATTGLWDYNIPNPSYVGTAVVQSGTQVTPGGSICLFTGNAAVGAGAGTNDVDDGKTTVQLQDVDLSAYTNPAIEYYRWYSNDQGATPGTDFWKVDISNDGGANWVPVENTKVADHSWRNVVIRVSDYVTPSSNIWMRFIADDANAGSLVEAMIDEWSVYEQGVAGITDVTPVDVMNIYPNPADKYLSVSLKSESKSITLEVEN